MTEKELEKKAFEYRKELVPFTELGYSDVALPVYDGIDVDRAFLAGAQLMQKELEAETQNLAKRICELQSDLAREKSKKNEL